jgi:predicted dehydrogenase
MSSMPASHSTADFSRRGFLKASSLAGAGLVLGAPAILRSQTPSDELKIALVGIGAQGRILLDAMLGLPGLHFQAVCDIWEYARDYGVKKIKSQLKYEPVGYADFEDMMAKEKGLDAVVIATPDLWHAPYTVAALKAGLHVYCEKMMSNTVEGARSMARAMLETGKLCQIGHQRRSNPRYLHVKKNLIDKAELCGHIVNINGQWNRAVTEDLGWPQKYEIPAETLQRYGYKDMHQFRNWRWFRELSGGPISDLGAHQIDIFNWFLGTNPKTVIASGGADYFKTREHFDNVMAIFEYETPKGPTRAFYQVLTTTSAGGGYFERFMGDEGCIKMSENPKYTQVYREERAKPWEDIIQRNWLRLAVDSEARATAKVDVRETAPLLAYDIPIVVDGPIHQPHLHNFFNAVRGKGTLNCDAKHAFESEYCIYQVNPAALQHTMITIKPEDYTL